MIKMKREKNIRLSKIQARNARRKANKELEKKKKSEVQSSSSSSEGKVMVGKVDASTSLLTEMKKMKNQIFKYEEQIFNQGKRIRELMNNIEDQNNELLEQQLYNQSQKNFKQGVNMIVEFFTFQAKEQEISIEQNNDKSLIDRTEKIKGIVFPQWIKKNCRCCNSKYHQLKNAKNDKNYQKEKKLKLQGC